MLNKSRRQRFKYLNNSMENIEGRLNFSTMPRLKVQKTK